MSARILVIEDNETNLDLMVYLLKAFGYTPIMARDGQEGLAAVRRERPDLIVCDLVMPRIDGYEVARRLKASAEFRSIPLIAVTALATVGEREKALVAGYDGYLPKPIEAEEFVPQIERYLKPAKLAGGEPHRSEAGGHEQFQPHPARNITVLVVDDSAANLQLMRSMLEPLGYDVLTCRGGTEAIAVLRGTKVDVVLCDLHMPQQTGFGFARSLRADRRLAGIPLVLLSNTASRARPAADILQEAGLKLISRPLEPQALAEVIEDCLQPKGSPHGQHPDR